MNEELNQTVRAIAWLLGSMGIKALAVPARPTESEVDGKSRATLRHPFSHKMAATRSGLGWIGKTDLLVTHAKVRAVREFILGNASKVGNRSTKQSWPSLRAARAYKRARTHCPARGRQHDQPVILPPPGYFLPNRDSTVFQLTLLNQASKYLARSVGL